MMEVCVDNIQSAINAAAGNASRIELCSALSEGGLTPSLGFFKTVRLLISIPIFVLLRPRRGTDFVYSKEEIDSIAYDALEFKNAGADGFVFGILQRNGTINSVACLKILEIVKPLPTTFHRAFDCVIDPFESLQKIIELGFNRILTSGQGRMALDGLETIKKLISKAEDKIIIVPGAGIDENNAYNILRYTGAKELHGSVRHSVHMPFNGKSIAVGSADVDNKLLITDVTVVQKIVLIVKQFNM